MKKIITLILMSVFVLGSMAGCTGHTNNNETNYVINEDLSPEKIGYYSTLKLPIDDKNTEISVFVSSTYTNMNDSIVLEELRRRTGLNVQLMIIPTSTVSQKVNVLLASGDALPDIFRGLDEVKIDEYAQQGAFEPVSDHLDELPNLKEIFYTDCEKYGITKDTVKGFVSSNGKLYTIPRYDNTRDVNHGFLYRKDIFDKHNIKVWDDKESFLNTLRQLKKIYPDSTPFVSKTGTGIFSDMGYQWGLKQFLQYYDETDKIWKMSSTDPKYKEMLDMLKTMYNEGLIDPEFITTTQPAWTNKMTQQNRAFVTWDWIGRLDQLREQTATTIPSYDLRYAPPVNGKVRTLGKASVGPVFKKSKKSLLAMKLCDYLLSESGARLMTMGVEGVTYNIGEDGFADYIGFKEGKAIGITDLEDKYGMFIERLYLRTDRKSVYFNFTEREQEAQDMMNNMLGGGYWPEDPKLLYTAEEQDVLSSFQTSFEKAAVEFSTKYVLDPNAGEKEWNEWLKKAKTLGEDKLLEIHNKAQKRFDVM